MQSHPDHADVAEPPAHDESYNSPQPLSDPGGNVTDNGTEDDLLSGAKSLGTAAESSAPLKANGLLEHTIDPGSNDITLGTDKGGDLLGDEALSAKKVRPKLPDASKLEGRETSEIADCDSATVSTTTLVRLTKGELPQSPKAPPPPPKDERFRTKPSMTGPSLMSLAREGNDPNFTEDSNLSLLAREMDAADGYEKDERANRGNADDSRSEIHSIMEQFDNGSGVLSAEEILSQRLEIGSPLAHPPRSSSLDHRGTETLIVPPNSSAAPTGSWIPPSETMANLTLKKKSLEPQVESTVLLNEKSSSVQGSQIAKTSTAQPDPEVALPFDFYRFLDQLRHRTADPVAKYVRSFLLEFAKKQWMVHEQVKIIGDFLEFISKRMAQCEVWSAVSEAEFDNAREGMEKLVMNRLYNQTFSPCIPSAEQAVDRSGRRKAPSPLRLGRRGQHQEDVERDKILAQKMRIYRWVSEKHLDIKEIREKGQKLLLLAQKELLKIDSYRAPRDKVICVLNCCKVIFGFLRTSQSDQSADSFIPLLIYTVLHAKPEHLVSNVQYILRFRNQDKLTGEFGYYISSLTAALHFVETLDRTSLTISDQEFENNVEAAVSAIAEGHSSPKRFPSSVASQDTNGTKTLHAAARKFAGATNASPRMSQVNLLQSIDAGRVSGSQPSNSRKGSLAVEANSESNRPGEEDRAAVASILRSIQRPLSSIGRIFSEDGNQEQRVSEGRRNSFLGSLTPSISDNRKPSRSPSRVNRNSDLDHSKGNAIPGNAARDFELNPEDAAARHASAELAEAQRVQRAEQRIVVDTLAGMFPDLDRDVIDDVVRMKDGRVGLAVDACLALSS